MWIHSNGGRVLSEDKTKCVITMPETVEAIQFQIDMLRVHKVSPLPDEMEVLGGGIPAFMSKRVGMNVTCIWDGASYRNIKDFEWAAAPLPKSPRTGYRRTNYKPNSMSIPSTARQPDVAWRWLSFDPIGQNRSDIDKATAMTAFEENKQYFLEKSPVKNAKVVFEHFEKGEITYIPLNTKWMEFEKIVNDELTLAQNGEKTVAEAAKVIEPKVNALLQS